MLRTALVIALTAVSGLTSIASAQQPMCTEQNQILNHLSNQYSEAPVAMGVINNGGVLKALSSRTGKSWTIILTMPSGVSCMIAACENWEALPTMTKVDPPT